MLRVYDRFEHIEEGRFEKYPSAQDWMDSLLQYDPDHAFSYAFCVLYGNAPGLPRTLLISRKSRYTDAIRRFAYVRGDNPDLIEISTQFPHWSPANTHRQSVLFKSFVNVDLAIQVLERNMAHAFPTTDMQVRSIIFKILKARQNFSAWSDEMKRKSPSPSNTSSFPEGIFPKKDA